MKLWGRVVSGTLLATAALFAGVAVADPKARTLLVGVAALLILAALFGVPALVRGFVSFTGDEGVLRDGAVAWATIVSLRPAGGGTTATIRSSVSGFEWSWMVSCIPLRSSRRSSPTCVGDWPPGGAVGVRVDRSDRRRVMVDTRGPIRAAVPGDR